MGEEWRRIEGYPLYEISNMGRVRSRQRCRQYHQQPITMLQPFLQMTRPGKVYLAVNLYTNGVPRIHYVKRLVWRAFRPDDKPHVPLYSVNGDPTDCRLANLATGIPPKSTIPQEMLDAIDDLTNEENCWDDADSVNGSGLISED